MDQAVNNGTPTETPYYRAADFGSRAVGWTTPYLDLVGAGMMITASYPVYDSESLLGVMSHDITLKELASSVLLHLTNVERSSALISPPILVEVSTAGNGRDRGLCGCIASGSSMYTM